MCQINEYNDFDYMTYLYPNMLTPPDSSDASEDTLTNSILIKPLSDKPYLKIIEQPTSRFRFRYKSEMTGTHGSLLGEKTDRSRKPSSPTVELINYNGSAIIRCSLYQYKASTDECKVHAHRLVKKEGKHEVDDPHDIEVSQSTGYICSFHGMGIIHTARKNIYDELYRKKLKLKKEEIALVQGQVRDLNLDEIQEVKNAAESESKTINLNIVCLRFDAFKKIDGILYPLCQPLISHEINNLKSALTGDLKIVRMDHCTSPSEGGREIFIFVERVTKKNIKIRFFELDDEDIVIWEDYGKFNDLDVHHQYAIAFRTPPYKNFEIEKPVTVYMELERPSDGARSEPKEFKYTPSNQFMYQLGSKRARHSYSTSYDSSNIPSDELPDTINDLHLENVSVLPDMEVTNEDIQKALESINSDEFHNLFQNFSKDFEIDTPSNMKTRTSINEKHITMDEDNLKKRVLQEIHNFLKTNPTKDRIIQMLNVRFRTPNKTNALHIIIKNNEESSLLILLNLINSLECNELLNIKNENGQTPLHLAIINNNISIINTLIHCKANLLQVDDEFNTILHIAIISNNNEIIFKKLLDHEQINEIINYENNDGNTPLNLAIDTNSFGIVKILCDNRNCNINKQHNKNGYNPLRFAIEKRNVDIIQYLLNCPRLDPLLKDFYSINALEAGLKNDNELINKIIKDYMNKNNIKIELQTEIDNYSDEDLFEENYEIKNECELEYLYSKVNSFTDDCLYKVSILLDTNKSWEKLGEALDLGHIMRSNLMDNNLSQSKFLIKFALESCNESVLNIRNILKNLNEIKAVQLIDNMVMELNYQPAN